MNIATNTEFKLWVAELKLRIRQSQLKAAIQVNEALLQLYWSLGYDIMERQMDAVWGSGFYENLSRALKSEFPDMKGFSVTNLKYCKKFVQFYSTLNIIRHQAGDELQTDNKIIIPNNNTERFENNLLFKIPWRHHVEIFTKCKTVDEALFYVQKTIQNGWSRSVLIHFMEISLYNSQAKAFTNFDKHLPDTQSDLAKETLKDPYNFDFLTLSENFKEKELENALVNHITKFLLELGQGFAYMGRQFPIQIGNRDRYFDLLFYHTILRCYVVVELKTTEFEPEHAGKLSFYVTAANHQLKHENHNPSIGLLICKTKDVVDVQFALESVTQPIGVAEYKLSKILPEKLQLLMPTIEEIEDNLKETL